MSLRSTQGAPLAEVSIANEFQRRFIHDAHILIAEGYERLDPRALADKQEEEISGLIAQRADEWLSEDTAPDWTNNYFIVAEVPETDGSEKGKKRPRVDISIQCNYPRPRPRLAFEAKRFYRGDSVSEYVGTGGLGAFVDGKYSPGEPAGAMLGYIQRGSCQAQAKKVKDKLGSNRREHGLERSGPVWQPLELDGRIGPTWVSTHNRANETPIRIYHSFLPCS